VTSGRVAGGRQHVDEDPDKVDWTDREVGSLLTRFVHVPEIARRLAELSGTWPFNATYDCEATHTRDDDYRQIAAKGKERSRHS